MMFVHTHYGTTAGRLRIQFAFDFNALQIRQMGRLEYQGLLSSSPYTTSIKALKSLSPLPILVSHICLPNKKYSYLHSYEWLSLFYRGLLPSLPWEVLQLLH